MGKVRSPRIKAIIPALPPAMPKGHAAQDFGTEAEKSGHLLGRAALQMFQVKFRVANNCSKMGPLVWQNATRRSIARRTRPLVPRPTTGQAFFRPSMSFAAQGFPDIHTVVKGHFESDSNFFILFN